MKSTLFIAAISSLALLLSVGVQAGDMSGANAVKAQTVTSSSRQANLPKADVKLTMLNYTFTFSKPLTPGKHTIEVVNAADQSHEAEIFKLNPGKTGEDLVRWVEEGMKGPAPGTQVADISAIPPGVTIKVTLDLEKGNYVLLCFMPDAKDGKSHVAHGMKLDIDV